MIEILFLIIILVAIGNILWYSWHYGITPTPTSPKVRMAIMNCLPELKAGQKIYELGSGWGTMAYELASHYPQCYVYALEISPLPYYFGKVFRRKANIQYMQKDLFSVPLENASLIFCYLYPGAMDALKEKFQKELQTGTYVITHTFSIPDWKPTKKVEALDLYRTPIFIYQAPSSKAARG